MGAAAETESVEGTETGAEVEACPVDGDTGWGAFGGGAHPAKVRNKISRRGISFWFMIFFLSPIR